MVTTRSTLSVRRTCNPHLKVSRLIGIHPESVLICDGSIGGIVAGDNEDVSMGKANFGDKLIGKTQKVSNPENDYGE